MIGSKGLTLTRFEKRKMERFSLEIPARFIWYDKSRKQESLELMTSNICSDGAFFKTEKPLSVGTDVKIDLIIPLDKLKKSITTPKKGGLMVTLKGSSIKAYAPQSHKDRRVFGFSFLLFAETPKSKMTQLFVEYNI